MFLNSLGVYTVNFAFGLNDERIHSPNEFFRLREFRTWAARLLHVAERSHKCTELVGSDTESTFLGSVIQYTSMLNLPTLL